MKTKLLAAAALAMLLSGPARADLELGQTYNSGYSGATALAPGASDLNFTLVGGTAPVVAYPTPSQWVGVSGAQFISPTEDQAYPADPPQGDPKGTYDYQAVLMSDFSVPTTLTVSGAFAADDYATVSVDGVPFQWTPGFLNSTPGYSSLTDFSHTFLVQAGSLPVTIDFVVYNMDDTADGIPINPTGLLVSDLQFNVADAPEPKTWAMLLGGLAVTCFVHRLRRLTRE